MSTVLETKRLRLKEFDSNDDEFIIELVNTPQWIDNIGDRGVKNKKDAINYLINGPIKSYKCNGFGLWKIEIKENNSPIGMCGLIKREYLENVDIGFALLPDYFGKGYGLEAAEATLMYAKNKLHLSNIVGITDATNEASIKLLNKIGLYFEKEIEFEGDLLLLFS